MRVDTSGTTLVVIVSLSGGRGHRGPHSVPGSARNMSLLPSVVLVLLCSQGAHFTDPESGEACVIELTCEECLPDNMPAVTSHAARDGAVRAAHGDQVTLSCGGGRFLNYPLLGELTAACAAGRYRVTHDAALRPLLDLGCQESLLEDVQHHVERCAPPLQGRAYRARLPGGGVRHLALLCYDEDRARAAWARAASGPLALPAHEERAAPLSLLGNFEHMFDERTRRDAERLFADEAGATRRLREAFKFDRFEFAGQSVAAGRLLPAEYFEPGRAHAAEFPSNKVGTWRSVARGNLRHLHADVAALVRRARSGDSAVGPVEVVAGTLGTVSLGGRAACLRAGGRFPVPRYVWTAVAARGGARGAVLVLLNDPFVQVSEIRAAVFCDSVCGELPWLTELRRQRRYERPLYGLVFCCRPRDALTHLPDLAHLYNHTTELLT